MDELRFDDGQLVFDDSQLACECGCGGPCLREGGSIEADLPECIEVTFTAVDSSPGCEVPGANSLSFSSTPGSKTITLRRQRLGGALGVDFYTAFIPATSAVFVCDGEPVQPGLVTDEAVVVYLSCRIRADGGFDWGLDPNLIDRFWHGIDPRLTSEQGRALQLWGYPNPFSPYMVPSRPDAAAILEGELAIGAPISHPNSSQQERYKFSWRVLEECPVEDVTGACCLSDGSCIDTTEAECNTQSGAFGGGGTECGTTDCPSPDDTGACCLPDGSCIDTTRADCTARLGKFQGTGVGCGKVACPEVVTGACCLPNGGCGDGTQEACEAAGGDFMGPGSTCALHGGDCSPSTVIDRGVGVFFP